MTIWQSQQKEETPANGVNSLLGVNWSPVSGSVR